jgi:aromatic-L-amino-acid/L-tryptophan decarboxylase
MRETNVTEAWQERAGDMPLDQFRAYGRQVVDWIADYLAHPERYPVLSQVRPGEIAAHVPESPPMAPEQIDDILKDFDDIIVPGITHWNQPGFFAYFPSCASAPAILAEMLSAALNANAMLWRTSPAATELETTTLNWLRQMIGLPGTFEGVIYDTASTSSLVAIAAAREATGLRIREKGMSGRRDLPRLRLYCSEQAHSSIERDAITVGIGQEGVRQIPVDAEFRMDVAALRAAVEQDSTAGWRPFCVVATVGTTSTTSVDPVRKIAAVCNEHGMWLHVDAAYAGAAAIVPEMRWLMEGVDEADSVVLNPHKWLFTPVDLSVLFSRRLDAIREAFSLVPEYLRTPESDTVRNYSEFGPQLGRRFRALKLWFILRAYGRDGLATRLREHIRLAQDFAGWIDADPSWERMAPAPLATVCFRACPEGYDEPELEQLNQSILDTINASGEAYLSHTRLHDKLTLRIAIGQIRTAESHVRRAWELLQAALRKHV